MDKLNLITSFLTVAQSGSFAAAAAHMGVDPSTVSKAMSQLETHLGCRLFIRTTRKLQLSSAGMRYRENCARLLEGLDVCEQALSAEQTEAKGTLKINLPVAYGQLYIMPLMGKFRQQYPMINLDISLTDDYVDMVAHSVDVAIRSGQLQDSRLVAKKLSPMDFATCAAPEFVKKNPPITNANIEDLPWVNYRFIHTGRTMPLYRLLGNSPCKQSEVIDPEIVLTTTDGFSMVKAAIEGMGLVQGPHFLLREAVMSGQLDIVQSYFRYDSFNVYAYYTSKDYLPQKVIVFLDFITSELSKIGEDYNNTFLSNKAL